jgi:NAD(P)H-flavin reductase
MSVRIPILNLIKDNYTYLTILLLNYLKYLKKNSRKFSFQRVHFLYHYREKKDLLESAEKIYIVI